MGSLTRKMTRQTLPKRRRTTEFDYMEVMPRNPALGLPEHRRAPVAPYISPYAHREGETPLDAYARKVGYSGPEMPDKGQKDGSCNRSACQLPLEGMPQWTMPSYGRGGTDGKLYYCEICAMKFHEADRDMRSPLRCTLEPDSPRSGLAS